MNAARLRREARARGEADPGPDSASVRLVRVRERDGAKFIRLFGKDVAIDGHGARDGDRVEVKLTHRARRKAESGA